MIIFFVHLQGYYIPGKMQCESGNSKLVNFNMINHEQLSKNTAEYQSNEQK